MRTFNHGWYRLTGIACLMLAALAILPAGCAGKSNAERLHEEGALLYKHAQYYKAIEKFEAALKAEPGRPGTLTLLADAYLKTSRPETAINYASEALKKQPDSDDASMILGQSFLALASIQTTQTLSGENEPNPQLLKKAEEIASKLRKKDPNSAAGMLLQAEIDMRNQQPRLAEQLYQAVLKGSPKDSRAAVGLARAQMAQKKFKAAIEVLEALKKQETPPAPQTFWELARAQLLDQQLDAAWATLEPNLAPGNKAPDLPQFVLAGHVLLARLQALGAQNAVDASTSASQPVKRLDKTKYDEIVKQLAALGSRMKGAWPQRPESWYFRGYSYQFQNKLAEAVSHFQEAIRRDPSNRDYRMALAAAHFQQKEYQLAREDLRNLLKAFPGDFAANLQIAQSYIMEGRAGDAITPLRQLQIENPDNKAVKQLLGQALVNSGDPSQMQEGLQLLEAANGALPPGGREFALGESAFAEAQKQMQTGDRRTAATKFHEAEGYYNTAVERQPQNAGARARLAELAEMRNDLVSALQHATMAAELKPDYVINEARLYTKLGQFEKADALYQKVLQAAGGNVAVQLEYAAFLGRAGRQPDAQKAYGDIIEKHPDEQRAYTGKAQMMTSTQGAKTAIAFLREATEKNPKLTDAAITLATMLIQSGDWIEAQTQLEKLTATLATDFTTAKSNSAETSQLDGLQQRLAPLYLELALTRLMNHEPAKAQDASAQALDAWRETKSDALITNAVALLYMNKPDEAIAKIDQLKNKNGELRGFLPLIKSLALLQKSGAEAAQEAIKNQTDLNENSIELYRDLFKRHKLPELKKAAPMLAMQIYLAQRPMFAALSLSLTSATLEILPKSPFVLARRAEAYQAQNLAEPSLECYAQLSAAMPNYKPVMLARIDLTMMLAQNASQRNNQAEGQRLLDATTQLCETALTRDASDVNILTRLSTIKQQVGKLDEANALYRKILALQPNEPAAANNLAWNLSEANQLDAARKIALGAAKAAPDNGGVLDTLGWIEFRQGLFAEAVKHLQQASQLSPTEADIRFHLAQATEKNGNAAQAAEILKTMLQAWPTYEKTDEVRKMLARLEPAAAR